MIRLVSFALLATAGGLTITAAKAAGSYLDERLSAVTLAPDLRADIFAFMRANIVVRTLERSFTDHAVREEVVLCPANAVALSAGWSSSGRFLMYHNVRYAADGNAGWHFRFERASGPPDIALHVYCLAWPGPAAQSF